MSTQEVTARGHEAKPKNRRPLVHTRSNRAKAPLDHDTSVQNVCSPPSKLPQMKRYLEARQPRLPGTGRSMWRKSPLLREMSSKEKRNLQGQMFAVLLEIHALAHLEIFELLVLLLQLSLSLVHDRLHSDLEL